MKIVWFEVQGYKNFRAPLRLEELGAINLVHGDNNVGKSNLLESIALYFVALEVLVVDGRDKTPLKERYRAKDTTPVLGTATRGHDYFRARGLPAPEIFDIEKAAPIILRAKLVLNETATTVGVTLVNHGSHLTVELVQLELEEGTELKPGSTDWASAVQTLFERLASTISERKQASRFLLVRTDRTVLLDSADGAGAASSSHRGIFPSDLALTLNEAHEGSTEVARRPFDAFTGAMAAFEDLVGAGRWRTRYLRTEDRAEVVFEKMGASAGLPIHLLGTGIQQLAVLIARLITCGSDIAAIEEPELNLKWEAQTALKKAFETIIDHPGGPSQLLLTSHSPRFEDAPTFYLLRRTDDGPVVERRASVEALQLTSPVVETPTKKQAPLAYVTSDGVVQVPAEVRQNLGILEGGGVTFVREREHGHYRMLTNEQFLAMLEDDVEGK